MDDDLDTSSWTPEQREQYRVEQLTDPLFDLWLRFEKAFTRLAMDRLNISDEDAEAAAKQMDGCDSDSARAYAYLLRQVRLDRWMRGFAHRAAVVWATNRDLAEVALSFDDVEREYAKLDKGQA
jgi:hypothetical protein